LLVLRRLRTKLVLAHSQCCVEVAVSSIGLVIPSESLIYLNLRADMKPVNLHFLHAGRSNFSFVSLPASNPGVVAMAQEVDRCCLGGTEISGPMNQGDRSCTGLGLPKTNSSERGLSNGKTMFTQRILCIHYGIVTKSSRPLNRMPWRHRKKRTISSRAFGIPVFPLASSTLQPCAPPC
jgi:hypothetical protein